MDKEEQFIGIREACEFLGVKRATLYSWVNKELVPCYKPTGTKGLLLFKKSELKEFIEKAWDWWDENAKMRERVGELINRLGMRAFLKAAELPAVPQMVKHPRENPFYFWDPEDVEESIQEQKGGK